MKYWGKSLLWHRTAATCLILGTLVQISTITFGIYSLMAGNLSANNVLMNSLLGGGGVVLVCSVLCSWQRDTTFREQNEMWETLKDQ
jgi:hypothetical protein